MSGMIARSLLATSLTSVIVVAAVGTAASAGTYVGLGIGSSSVSDNGANDYVPDGRSARLMVGMRFGNISAEAAYTGYGLVKQNSGNSFDSRGLSAALKLSIPLGNNFEAYGRGGLMRTWLTLPGDAKPAGLTSYSGDGYTVSAGFEYRLNLVLAGASLFVDYTRNTATLSADMPGYQPLDQSASLWTLGLLVSL